MFIVPLGDRVLRLNGAGVRHKLVFRVYVGALFLERPSADAAGILAADAPWLVRLWFLRDVDHERIIDSFREAFEHNSPGQLAQFRREVEQFHDAIADVTLHRSEVLTVSYQPGAGTTLEAPSGARATVAGHAFGEAILRTWLGAHPSDAELKRRMLGGGDEPAAFQPRPEHSGP